MHLNNFWRCQFLSEISLYKRPHISLPIFLALRTVSLICLVPGFLLFTDFITIPHKLHFRKLLQIKNKSRVWFNSQCITRPPKLSHTADLNQAGSSSSSWVHLNSRSCFGLACTRSSLLLLSRVALPCKPAFGLITYDWLYSSDCMNSNRDVPDEHIYRYTPNK